MYPNDKLTLCDIKRFEHDWMTVADFMNETVLSSKVAKLDALAESNIVITLLDERAIWDCERIKKAGQCNSHLEFLITLFSFANVKRFVGNLDEFKSNPGFRFPNGKKEKLNFYVFSINFTHGIRLSDTQIEDYLPDKEDNWRLYGRKYKNELYLDAICPKCIFKDDNLFCTDDDLKEEATTK